MKKKRRRVRTRIKVIGVLLLGYILFFAFTSIYYRDKWYPNTTVNSIDVSNLTYNESKEEIADRVNNYQLEIIGKNDISFKINGKDIDLKATYEKNLEKSFSNHLDDRSLFGIFANHDYEVNLKITYNQDKLEKIINNSVLVNGSDDYKIEDMTLIIEEAFGSKNELYLDEVFTDAKDMNQVITLFLATLELIKVHRISGQQETIFGTITLRKEWTNE